MQKTLSSATMHLMLRVKQDDRHTVALHQVFVLCHSNLDLHCYFGLALGRVRLKDIGFPFDSDSFSP